MVYKELVRRSFSCKILKGSLDDKRGLEEGSRNFLLESRTGSERMGDIRTYIRERNDRDFTFKWTETLSPDDSSKGLAAAALMTVGIRIW